MCFLRVLVRSERETTSTRIRNGSVDFFSGIDNRYTTCCMLILDRAVNQIFSAQDTFAKVSGSSQMLNENRGCYEMIHADVHVRVSLESLSVSASLQRSIELADRELWPHDAKRLPGKDRLSTSHRKKRRKALKITQRGPQQVSGWVPPGWEAEEGLCNPLKITQCGMVKKKEVIGQYTILYSSPSIHLSPSHHRRFNPFRE